MPALAALAARRAPHALLHVDCVQALGKLRLDIGAIGAHSIVLSAHKVHGPKGCGALVLAAQTAPGDGGAGGGWGGRRALLPLVHGGGHEGGLRSGTENVAAIVGMGRAVALAANGNLALARHRDALRGAYGALEAGLAELCPAVTLLQLREPMALDDGGCGGGGGGGGGGGAREEEAAAAACATMAAEYSRSIATLLMPEVPAEGYMNFLQRPGGGNDNGNGNGNSSGNGFDEFGVGMPLSPVAVRPAVYVGIGSACQARESKLSPALTALGLTEQGARRALRLSISWLTTAEEVRAACAAVRAAVEALAPGAAAKAATAAAAAAGGEEESVSQAFAALSVARKLKAAASVAEGQSQCASSSSRSTGSEEGEGSTQESEASVDHSVGSVAAVSAATTTSTTTTTTTTTTAAAAVTATSAPPAPMTLKAQNKACAFFSLPRGCIKGDKCIFAHTGVDGKARAAAMSKLPGSAPAPAAAAAGACSSGHCQLAPASSRQFKQPSAPMLRSTHKIAPFKHADGGRSCISAPALEPLSAATAQALLVREDELTLKCQDKSLARGRRSNYAVFQNVLVANLRVAARSVSVTLAAVERQVGRVYLHPAVGTTCGAFEALTQRCRDVFGVQNVSPVWKIEKGAAAIDAEQCFALANRVLDAALAAWPEGRPLPTIRVKAQISQQKFRALTGWGPTRFAVEVAERCLGGRGLRVDLTHPEMTLQIEVRGEGTVCSAVQLPALKGLPVGSSGRAITLLSGGIDSPVASYMMMSRGISITYVSFHSYPYLGEQSKQKLASLVRQLSRYQPFSRLWIVPFTSCQVAIRDHCPENYRTVLYRRMMQRIASKIAFNERAQMLVTGECLGQVASQTMQNMTCINDASSLPVLRPLVGINKPDTIATAMKIGTYDISIQDEPDCCTVFMPKGPVLNGKIDECEAAEAAINVDALVQTAIADMELYCELPPGIDPATWQGYDNSGCHLCGMNFRNKSVIKSHVSGKMHQAQLARMKKSLRL